MLIRRITTAIAGVLALVGCAPTSFKIPGAPVGEAAYTAFYPTYAEVCAVSQISKIPGFGADLRGGSGGHSVLYLNGACLDGAGYPVLRACRAGDPDTGVGISANAHFRNANWVAIPGRELFFHGLLADGARLDQAAYARTQKAAKRLGLYDAVQFYPEYFADKPAGVAERDWKYEISVATDYAIDFGRGRYCARQPVSPAQMARMIAFLNARNDVYRDGHADYEWNVLEDNCSHLTHNALAATGLWDEWPIDRFVLVAALDFPVPKNEFVNLMRRTNDLPVDDLAAIYEDPAARRMVLAGDGLPTRPGALADAAPARPNNALYRTDLRLIFYDEALTGRYARRLDMIEANPRYHDLAANLHYFDQLDTKITVTRHPLQWWQTHNPSVAANADFAPFYQAYYAAIDRQQTDTSIALARLASTRPMALLVQ